MRMFLPAFWCNDTMAGVTTPGAEIFFVAIRHGGPRWVNPDDVIVIDD